MAEEPAGEAFGADVDARLLKLDDDVSEIGGGWEEEIHFAFLGRSFLAFDFVEGVQAALLFCATGFDTGAHPFEL